MKVIDNVSSSHTAPVLLTHFYSSFILANSIISRSCFEQENNKNNTKFTSLNVSRHAADVH